MDIMKLLKTEIFSSPSLRDLGVFLNQLSMMTKSGLSIHESLKIILTQEPSRRLKRPTSNIIKKLESGKMLSEAVLGENLKAQELLSSLIKAGELSGSLSQSLGMMSSYYEKKDKTIRQIRTALIYPIILMATCILVLIFVILKVLPSFVSMFESSKIALPLPTRIVIGVSSFLSCFWLYILSIFLALFIIFMGAKKFSKPFKYALDKFSLKLPVIGKMTLYQELFSISSIMSILSSSGVAIIEIIEIFSLTDNLYFKKIYLNIKEDLKRGIECHMAFSKEKVFPPRIIML